VLATRLVNVRPLHRRLLAGEALRPTWACRSSTIGVCLYGWWEWLHGGPAEDGSPSRVRAPLALALTVAGRRLPASSVAPPPRNDARCPSGTRRRLAYSLVAQWLQTKKRIESGRFWIASTRLHRRLRVKGLWLTALLYAISSRSARRPPRTEALARWRADPRTATGGRLRPLRFVVIGSECTGKTTLAGALGVAVRSAVGAGVLPRVPGREEAPLDASDVEPIASGTIVEAAPRTARDGFLVLDTTSSRRSSTPVTTTHLPRWIDEAAESAGRPRPPLCTPTCVGGRQPSATGETAGGHATGSSSARFREGPGGTSTRCTAPGRPEETPPPP